MNLLIITVIVCYALWHAISIASLGTRVAGRLTKRKALGTSLSHTVCITADFFVILLLPTLGFLVESGISIDDYLVLVLFAYSLTFIVSFIILINLNKIQHIYQIIFYK